MADNITQAQQAAQERDEQRGTKHNCTAVAEGDW